MARPSKYTELDIAGKLDAIRGWAMQGSTDEELAKMLGIGVSTLYEWKKDKPEFAEAIKKGKEVSNGEVLNSAFRQAVGYYVTEQQAVKIRTNEVVPTADGKGVKYLPTEKVEVIDVQKFVPANPTMSIFMLKNRLPAAYKDKQTTEIEGGVKVEFALPPGMDDLLG